MLSVPETSYNTFIGPKRLLFVRYYKIILHFFSLFLLLNIFCLHLLSLHATFRNRRGAFKNPSKELKHYMTRPKTYETRWFYGFLWKTDQIRGDFVIFLNLHSNSIQISIRNGFFNSLNVIWVIDPVNILINVPLHIRLIP